MTPATLTFRPRAFASEIATVGAHTFAEIIPCGHRATILFKFAGMLAPNHPASSFEAARRKVEHEVREWFMAADLPDVASSLVVRVLTDKEDTRRAHA